MITIKKLDECFLQVLAEPGILHELAEQFEFFAPNYKFAPTFKSGFWDGKIRLLKPQTGVGYVGMLPNIVKFCKLSGYDYSIQGDFFPSEKYPQLFAYTLAQQWDTAYPPRDYQNQAVVRALNNNRIILQCPTASGKSYMIYLLARHHVEHKQHRVLIIVPRIGLISQLTKDFKQYDNGHDFGNTIAEIRQGTGKDFSEDIVLSTWQSIYQQPESWFKQFDVIIGDEAHHYKAKSLISIMEKAKHVRYRYGLTGTIDEGEVNKLTLEGLFGPVYNVRNTRQLIDDGTLSEFQINAIVLKHPQSIRKQVHAEVEKYRKYDKRKAYRAEVEALYANTRRNKYIYNLAQAQKGNTLVLFQQVEKHGDLLYDLFKQGEKPLHYIHGQVSPEQREHTRQLVEQTNNNIILASYGTFSTGINITRLDNVIFASPSKSKIRNLQSIGRVLRKSKDNNKAYLFDIVDDLSINDNQNFALHHFNQRVQIYSKEQFDIKVYNVDLKE